MSWNGKCNLCGYESRLESWFTADGKIVQCHGCKKFIVRQECEDATTFRRYSARPDHEIIVPRRFPVNTLLELANATMGRCGTSEIDETASGGAETDY